MEAAVAQRTWLMWSAAVSVQCHNNDYCVSV